MDKSKGEPVISVKTKSKERVNEFVSKIIIFICNFYIYLYYYRGFNCLYRFIFLGHMIAFS